MGVHFYIDNLAHGGSVISTYEVLQPQFTFNLSDAGTCSWDLALSQTQVNGTAITQDEFAPKKTDYRLRGNDGVQNLTLQAGRLLDVNLESDTGTISCSGKDWLEYLNQPWYFDGYQQSVFTLSGGNVKAWVGVGGADTQLVSYNATQQKIIQEILTHANLLSDIAYTANFSGSGWSTVLEYMINFLDETTLMSHIQAISDYAAPLGFDFWCDYNKQINFYSPRLVTNPTTPPPSQIAVSLTYGVDPVIKVNWHNAGPKATRTVGKNSVNLWKERSYAPTITTYRDELEVVDLGQKYDFGRSYAQIQNQIDIATDAQGSFDWNPQKDITLTVLPDRIFPASQVNGFRPMLGKVVYFDSAGAFLPYHRVNAYYYIVSQTYRTDDSSGNYVLDLGLQQVYT
jgi:hypothetical protein